MTTPTAPAAIVTRLYLHPAGNDQWSGRLSVPNAAGDDGPLASPAAAQAKVRALRADPKFPDPIEVILADGVYPLAEPLLFTPADSGAPAPSGDWQRKTGPVRSVTWTAAPGARPVLSGGQRLTGWRADTVHGRPCWVTDLPTVASGAWNFTQLWVNGRRARRPRLPRHGTFRVAELLGEVVWEGPEVHKVLFTGQDQFRAAPGDLQAWRNVADIEFVALHFWIESRINFTRIDPTTGVAHLAWKSRMRLTDDFTRQGAPYYVENIFEALAEPGEWYLDRPSGRLYYLPRPGEELASAVIVAPRLHTLLTIQGETTPSQPVQFVNFRGLTLAHTEWVPGPERHTATPQAACHVPGAVRVLHARDLSFEQCAITQVGSYALEIGDASTEVTVRGCRLSDLGGGGVKVWHSADPKAKSGPGGGADMSALATCRRILIRDCEISDGGYRFHQAVGVLLGRVSGVQVLHNHIHNFDYTGVSVGWCWGYAEGLAYGNVVEYNHIHDIGRGMLSDMGGIYTLSVQPGTRLRYNLIHDVESRGYGGWGIYTDEGSSHILVENNVVYRTKSQGFHQHYGRENLIVNNIFAYGREAQIARSRLEPHESFTFARNLILASNANGKLLAGQWQELRANLHHNLYWHLHLKPGELDFGGGDFAAWQARGADAGSILADPRFRAPHKGDFTLPADSPALALGFLPIDLSEVGPRVSPGPGCGR